MAYMLIFLSLFLSVFLVIVTIAISDLISLKKENSQKELPYECEVLIFIFILILGLMYVWVKGDLEWKI